MKRARKKFKTFKLTPIGDSGLSDVNENHDYYLAEAARTDDRKPAPGEKATSPAPSQQSHTWKK